jgi:hypothetical protein
MKAVCTSIKLCTGSGSRSCPSSLLPHPHDQHTTYKCHPFSPTPPATFLTWLRLGVRGVTVLTVLADYCYYTFKNIASKTLHFLRNDSVLRSLLLLYIPKTSLYFLRNDHSMNIVGRDQEFRVTDVGR